MIERQFCVLLDSPLAVGATKSIANVNRQPFLVPDPVHPLRPLGPYPLAHVFIIYRIYSSEQNN